MEDLFGEFDGPFHAGAATGDDDARCDRFIETAAAQLLGHQAEQLGVARLDDLGQGLPRQATGRPITDARHLDGLL